MDNTFEFTIDKGLKEKLENLGVNDNKDMNELVNSLLEEYTEKTKRRKYTKEDYEEMSHKEYWMS